MLISRSNIERVKELSRIVEEQLDDHQACTDLATAAAHLCGGRVGLIALETAARVWCKAHAGVSSKHVSKEISFCEWAMSFSDHLLVVRDMAAHPRFANYAGITGALGIRFFAGVPLATPTGQHLGILCVLNHKPKQLAREQLDLLVFLSRQVAAVLGRNQAFAGSMAAAQTVWQSAARSHCRLA